MTEIEREVATMQQSDISLMTVTQAAALARVSRARIYELIRLGILTVAPESPAGTNLLRTGEFEAWRQTRRAGRPRKPQ